MMPHLIAMAFLMNKLLGTLSAINISWAILRSLMRLSAGAALILRRARVGNRPFLEIAPASPFAALVGAVDGTRSGILVRVTSGAKVADGCVRGDCLPDAGAVDRASLDGDSETLELLHD